ncbi:MAG TPA: citrate (pro-3S)-lyase subunit beta [Dissulfurispiraceae bacterium]|nr:citrate (pro-3S)-lyase subunit beta [Dissulfurispiraceae bacterium]
MRRMRRSMLYVPGNNPGMIRDVHIYRSDAIMFDLEDSVSLNEKDAARMLLYNSLLTFDFGQAEILVRVNGLNTAFGRDDFEAIVRARPDAIRLPKTDTPEDVVEADELISGIERQSGIETGSIKLVAAIESALGVINAPRIAMASGRLIGMALGAEDFVTDLKTSRSADGIELLTARSMVLFAARAAGIDAFDTVFPDVNDEEGFIREVKLIKQLGFDGKSIINPRQIEIVHQIFTPTEAEITYAMRVLEAIREAESKGSGVISLNGKMIDKPIVERARRVLAFAEAAGGQAG